MCAQTCLNCKWLTVVHNAHCMGALYDIRQMWRGISVPSMCTIIHCEILRTKAKHIYKYSLVVALGSLLTWGSVFISLSTSYCVCSAININHTALKPYSWCCKLVGTRVSFSDSPHKIYQCLWETGFVPSDFKPLYVNSYSASCDNWCTVGGDGGCRVGEVRAGTTSPMPDHKGFKLQ